MSTNIVPATIVPSDVAETLKVWQDRGLVPMDATPEQFIQSISIRHDCSVGQMQVKLNGMDGAQALGLLADAMAIVWRDWFQRPLRPALNSGQSKVCIQLDGDRLSMAFGTQDPANPEREPFADPLIAKGMMVAALFGLCEKTDGQTFNPLDALLGKLSVEVTPDANPTS